MPRLLFLAIALAALFASVAQAQPIQYTHTSGPSGDGFVWDSPLLDGENFLTDDGVVYENYIGDDTFFDTLYDGTQLASGFTGDAWWGNPDTGGFGTVDFDFFEFNDSGQTANRLSFDFAWANSTEDVIPFLSLSVFDSDGLDTFLDIELTEFFDAGANFGHFDGAAGRIVLDASQLFNMDDPENPLGLIDIEHVEISVGDVADGGIGEFAIDNVTINGDTSGSGSNVHPESNSASTKFLRGSFDASVQLSVVNDGSSGTTYSATLDATSDSEFFLDTPPMNVPIAASQSLGTGPVGRIDKNEPSGTYVAQIRVSNDLEPTDPDELYAYTVNLYDAPSLTDNSGGTIDVNANPSLSITNAAAGPHAGALRAGVEVTARTFTGGFGAVGLAVDDFVAAGTTEIAGATFNRFGKLTKNHTGSATLDLAMNSAAGSFLNGDAPVPSIVWNLAFDLADTLADSASINQDAQYNDNVGINTTRSAATLIGGTSPTTQTVDMDVVANTGTNGTLASDVVDLDFSTGSGLYVLQFTYDVAQLPFSLAETDLRLLVLSGATWGEAIDGNSDGGAGGTSLFAGSLDEYLNALGGGILDAADLSVFGVDVENSTAWAVLDHASVFSLGTLAAITTVPGDYNLDGTVDAADYTTWRDHLGSSAALPNDTTPGVGQDDYTRWKANFGMSASAGSLAAPIPEPSTVCLGLIGSLLILGGRKMFC